jgi:FkbM family methyltransferase
MNRGLLQRTQAPAWRRENRRILKRAMLSTSFSEGRPVQKQATAVRLRLRQHVVGKYRSLRILTEFCWHFKNWKQVFEAYRAHQNLPPFQLRNGMKVFHKESEDQPLYLFREIFENRVYTRNGFYRPKRGDVVVDIGANIGFFALLIQSMAPGSTVHCFEPAASARERLMRNVRANNLQPSVIVHPLGVSDHNGYAALSGHANSGQRSLAKIDGSNNHAESVAIVDLATALAMTEADDIALLKIDIEGSEIELMRGSQIGDWSSVRRVAMEFHGSIRPGCREEMADALRERGFRNIRFVSLLRVYPSLNDSLDGVLHASR